MTQVYLRLSPRSTNRLQDSKAVEDKNFKNSSLPKKYETDLTIINVSFVSLDESPFPLNIKV